VTRVQGVVLPRHVASVELVGDSAGVHITWRLGDVVSTQTVRDFAYSVVVTGNRGSFVRTYSFRFEGTADPEVTAEVHELLLAARGPSSVGDMIVTDDSVSAQFIGAGLGADPHDDAQADLRVNGVLVQQKLSVIVVEG
jgi:hypothetical protein